MFKSAPEFKVGDTVRVDGVEGTIHGVVHGNGTTKYLVYVPTFGSIDECQWDSNRLRTTRSIETSKRMKGFRPTGAFRGF